jgi:hypothetical protein
LCNRRDADLEHFIGWGCCLYELGAHDEARKALLSAPAPFRSNGLWNYHLAVTRRSVDISTTPGPGSNRRSDSIPACGAWPCRTPTSPPC